MSRSKALFGLFVIAAVAGTVYSGRLGNFEGVSGQLGAAGEFAKKYVDVEQLAAWFPPLKWIVGDNKAPAQAPPPPRSGPPQRAVNVEVAKSVRKKTPVLLEAIGNVTTMASVAVRPRLDSEIVGVHFADGAYVKKGELLVTLDSRAIDRYTELVAKAATPVINLENAKTQADTFRAAIIADTAALENLKVQLSYCRITAPITGRISMAAVKVGNIARAADTLPIATINQMAPIYVTFTVPQRNLPELRVAMAETGAPVEIIVPGDKRRARGMITMIENTIDPTTGMATVRATMPNEDELLWPGTLVTAQVTLRSEEAVVVPTAAVQVSQQGNFVFVVKDNVATVKLVKVARLLGAETVIEQGVDEGDTVVTDGHLLLTGGARVTVRERKTGA
jgi:membrane fusion protein, multidrug efflux system